MREENGPREEARQVEKWARDHLEETVIQRESPQEKRRGWMKGASIKKGREERGEIEQKWLENVKQKKKASAVVFLRTTKACSSFLSGQDTRNSAHKITTHVEPFSEERRGEWELFWEEEGKIKRPGKGKAELDLRVKI